MSIAFIIAASVALVFLHRWIDERNDRKRAEREIDGYAQSLAVSGDDRRRLLIKVGELKAENASLRDERNDQRAAILKIVGPKGSK